MATRGSVEIVRAGGSTGIVGEQWEVSDVPVVLRNLHGIHSLSSVTPVTQPTGRTPNAKWSGKDANNQDVTVMLWGEAK